MSIREDIEAERREAAGLPVLVCPNCGKRGVRHFEPAHLDENEFPVPGVYTCETKANES